MEKRMPLVSILIPNYNHSRFLDECIQSALAQTYPAIEIIVLDNQSEDESVHVAAQYRKYGVKICRNMVNCINKSYSILADTLSRGDFLTLLCADDSIHPTFVEKAVGIMQRYPNVGYVHGERDFVRDDGSIVELEPFFNCSFVAPGASIMPLYMVTTIAHPAQGIFRRSSFNAIGGYDMEIDHENADKSLWFYLSGVSDYGYIREKMCRIRVAAGSETITGIRNFQHPLLEHLIINDFLRFAEQYGYPDVLARKQQALSKLTGNFVDFAGDMLLQGNYDAAKMYLVYARVLHRDIINDERWQKLMAMYDAKACDREYITRRDVRYERRSRNYSPPDGFEQIEVESLI